MAQVAVRRASLQSPCINSSRVLSGRKVAGCLQPLNLWQACSSHRQPASSCRPGHEWSLSSRAAFGDGDGLRSMQQTGASKRKQANRQLCRASATEGSSELSELEKVQKLDKLIDKLRDAADRELPQIVAQNVMELDQTFWLRMATRADVCKSEDDKEDYMELSQRVMSLVDKIVKKTEEKIDDNAGVLEMVLDAAAEETGEWKVPLSKERINAMRKIMDQRQEYLDETFLASVFAYSRKVEKESLGSMLVVLQRVMQLWASWYLTKHPKGRVKKDKKTPEEAVLERILKAEVEDWDPILRENLVFPQSKLNEEKFFNTIQSRMERSILYMENGSYSQRVVAEYLREIQARSAATVEASKAPPPEIKLTE